MAFDAAEHGDLWELNLQAYPGLTVRVRRPGFAAKNMLRRAAPILLDSVAPEGQVENAKALLFGALADSIHSWTLKWRGRPLAPTRRNVLAQDESLLLAIAAAWRNVIAPPRRELGDDLAARRAVDEQLRDLPMEALGGEPGTDEPEPDEVGESGDGPTEGVSDVA